MASPTIVVSLLSDVLTIAPSTSDTRPVEQQTKALTVQPNTHPVLHNSDVAYAVCLARAEQADFVTDSHVTTFRTQYSLLLHVRAVFSLLCDVGMFLRVHIITYFGKSFLPILTGNSCRDHWVVTC